MKRRMIALLLTLCMVISLMPASVFAAEAEQPAAVTDEPAKANLEIATPDDLASFRDRVNSGENFAGQTVKLTADLNLSWDWTPIGSKSHPFKGSFDGGNHTIKGLRFATQIDSNNEFWYSGFFGTVEGAEIKNLTLQVGFESNGRVGGLVGCINAAAVTTISNVTVNGSVKSEAKKLGSQTTKPMAEYAAGIVCKIDGTTADHTQIIENCVNNADVQVDGTKAAGILGNNMTPVKISKCTNTGSISVVRSDKEAHAAGILCYAMGSSEITDCKNNGVIRALNANVGNVGGILSTAHYNSRISGDETHIITGCVNEADISTSIPRVYGDTRPDIVNVGGLVGRINGATTIRNCQTTGNIKYWISTAHKDNVGYIAGLATPATKLENITASGSFLSASDSWGRTTYGGQIYGKCSAAQLDVTNVKVPYMYNAAPLAVVNMLPKEPAGTFVSFADLLADQNQIIYSNTLPDPVQGQLLAKDEIGQLVPVTAIVNNTCYSSLQAAVAAAQPYDTVTLLQDVVLSETVVLDKNIVLDLNGHTVSSAEGFDAAKYLFESKAPEVKYKKVQIRNGSIVSATARGVHATAGRLYLEAVNMSTFKRCLHVEHAEVKLDQGSVLEICQGGIDPAVYIGSKDATQTKQPTLEVRSAKLDSSRGEYAFAAIQGNGSDTSNPYIKVFDGAELISAGDAIYAPQEGLVYIYGGTLTGSTAIEIRAGSLYINGGVFNATAEAFAEAPHGSGSTVEGAAVAVSQHTTNKYLDVTILDGTFNGIYAFYEKDLQDTQVDKITGSIRGGNFNGKAYSQNLKNFINEGIFTEEPAAEYIADGYAAKQNADGKFIVGKAPVAMIGTHGYETLRAAVDAAKSGDTVQLVRDIEITKDYGFEQICVTTKMTLDFNGHTITTNHAGKNSNAALFVNAGGDLTLTGKGGIKVLNGGYCVHVNGADAVVNVESGTYHGAITAINIQKGTANIKGGSFSVAPTADGKYDYLLNCIDSAYTDGSAKIVVTGGTFEKFNPAASNGEPNGPVNLVAAGYEATQSGEAWTVAVIANPVAKIGEIGYKSFKAAFDAAQTGDTIELVRGFVGGSELAQCTGKEVNVILGGEGVNPRFNISKDTVLTDVHMNIQVKSGAAFLFENQVTTDKMTLTLNGGTVLNVDGLGTGNLGVMSAVVTLNVEGEGTQLNAKNMKGNATNGGTFNVANSAVLTMDGAGSYGLSCNGLNVDNATVTIKNTGYSGVYTSSDGIKLTNGAKLTVESCGRLLPLESKWSHTYAPVQLKNGTVDVDATSSIVLNNNVDKDGNSINYIHSNNKNTTNNYAVAQITGDFGVTQYLTLQDAVDAANGKTTVKLLKTIEGNGVKIPAGKDIVLDFGGFTYTINTKTVGSTGTETNGFQLLKGATVIMKNGTLNAGTSAKILVQKYCDLTLEDMNLVGGPQTSYVLSNNNGKTVLKGNTNITAAEGKFAFDCYYWPSNTYGDNYVVTENLTGTITGKIEHTHDNTVTDEQAKAHSGIALSSGTYTVDPSTFVADGYEAVKEGDIYTVKQIMVAEINGTQYATLEAAVNTAKAGETVTLLRDAEVGPNYILVRANITIDLAGHTVTSNNTIYTYNGATIKNGSFVATAKGLNPIYANGGKLKLNNLKIDSNASAVYIADGEVTIDKDCVFTLAETAAEPVVTIIGKNTDAYPKVKVSGKLDASKTAGCAALQGNGADNSDPWMEIKDGAQLISNATAIYKPNGGTLYITGGTITGSTAVEVRAGTLNVRGGTLTSTAAAFEKAPNGNGATMTGAAIAVSQHTTNKDISIVIWEGTFSGPCALYEEDLQDTQSANIDFSVYGGTFNGKFYTQNATKFAKGGDFAEAPAAEYLVDGYSAQETADGRYIVDKTPVAMIAEQSYPTLRDAIEAAKSGDTVKLIADIEITRDSSFEQICVTTKMTLDFNGHTITTNHTGKNNNAALFVNAGGDLTLTGEGGIKVLNGGYCVHVNGADAVVNVVSGTYQGNTTAVNVQQGTANIKGGSFSILPNSENNYNFVLNCIDGAYTDGSAKIVVTGGTFEKFNPAASNGEPNGPVNLVAAGYEAVADGENYTVKQLMVAEVNGTQYATLQEAVAAAKAGETVKLIRDVVVAYPTTAGDGLRPDISIDKDLTLDLAGHTIKRNECTGSVNGVPAFFAITAGVNVTVTGNGIIDTELGDNSSYGINLNHPDAVLTIENGTFLGAPTAIQVQQGTLNVKGGTFDMSASCKAAAPAMAKYIINCIDPAFKDGTAKIIVTGGSFVGFDPSANPEGAGTTYLAPGYKTENNNGIYTVVLAGVCMIKETGVSFESIGSAMSAAEAGQTIVMMADRTENMVMIDESITVDLNGTTLETAYLVAFDGHMIDTAANKGTLKVARNKVSLYTGNKYMPIWNGVDGYQFAPAKLTQQWINTRGTVEYTGTGFVAYAKPAFGRVSATQTFAKKYLTDGGADNGLTIIIRLSWTTPEGHTASQDFEFSQAMVAEVYTATDKAFTLTVTDVGDIAEVTIQSVVKSTCNVEAVGSEMKFTASK